MLGYVTQNNFLLRSRTNVVTVTTSGLLVIAFSLEYGIGNKGLTYSIYLSRMLTYERLQLYWQSVLNKKKHSQCDLARLTV